MHQPRREFLRTSGMGFGSLALAGLREAWRTAAEATPHGQPVRLNAATRRLSRADPD